ncbi:MAG TPA: cupin domain-containing protein [Rhodanobacteraceae bacterium]|nr:cupin domain-containing protein [Rhodanobacteraceae bacterium]
MPRTSRQVQSPDEVHGSVRQLLGMPPGRFLREYWQKRPLLVRGAFPDFQPPLQPEDLAGLSCEETALSRLVVHEPRADRWSLRHGPFDDATFAALADRDWTLLVQDVDKWDTDVAALLDRFDFLPSWRIDDVMVSYATDGGGVGAHVDQYDVFLLQGPGRRRWSVSDDPAAPPGFREDSDLRLLRQFKPTHAWTLGPGDMLYLPPGVPHEGVAVGECMTFSIGMRAPAVGELLPDFADEVAEALPEARRYADPDLAPAARAGEIDAQALARVAEALGPAASLMDDDARGDWFGRYITRYRSAQAPAPPDRATRATTLSAALAGGVPLLRHPWTRMAWRRGRRGTTLFVCGEAHPCSTALARRLCAERGLAFAAPPTEAELSLLLTLVNGGHLVLQRRSRR